MAGPIPPMKRIRHADRNLQQVQDNAAKVFEIIREVPLLNGALIEDVEIGTGDTNVNHKLARNLQGWFITDIQGDANVWRTGDDIRNITLRASATVTISLWVF